MLDESDVPVFWRVFSWDYLSLFVLASPLLIETLSNADGLYFTEGSAGVDYVLS